MASDSHRSRFNTHNRTTGPLARETTLNNLVSVNESGHTDTVEQLATLVTNTDAQLVNQAQMLVNDTQLLADTSQMLTNDTQLLADTSQMLTNDTQLLADTSQMLTNDTQLLADTSQMLTNDTTMINTLASIDASVTKHPTLDYGALVPYEREDFRSFKIGVGDDNKISQISAGAGSFTFNDTPGYFRGNGLIITESQTDVKETFVSNWYTNGDFAYIACIKTPQNFELDMVVQVGSFHQREIYNEYATRTLSTDVNRVVWEYDQSNADPFAIRLVYVDNETVVRRASFSDDKLDGTGPSGLNFTGSNHLDQTITFAIRKLCNDYMFYIVGQDQVFYRVHTALNDTSVGGRTAGNDIWRFGGMLDSPNGAVPAAAIEFQFKSFEVFAQPLVSHFFGTHTITPIAVTAGPILAIRVDEIYSGSFLKPLRFTYLTDVGANHALKIYFNDDHTADITASTDTFYGEIVVSEPVTTALVNAVELDSVQMSENELKYVYEFNDLHKWLTGGLSPTDSGSRPFIFIYIDSVSPITVTGSLSWQIL